MKIELQRFKDLGRERAVVEAVPEKKTPAPANGQRTRPRSAATPKAGEITSEEKKQLEDILRVRRSHRGMSYTRRCQSGTSVSQSFSFSILSLQDSEAREF